MKVDLILRHVSAATMVGGHYALIPHAALAIADGLIAWIGEEAALPAVDAHRTLDGHGGLITPGLIDCHTHLVYAGNRADEFEQRLNGASYEEIARRGGGILSTVRATRGSTAEALAAATRPRLHSLLAEGVTTVEIKTGYGLDTTSESRMVDAMDLLAAESPEGSPPPGGGLPPEGGPPPTIHKTFLGAHALPPEYAGRADAYVDLVCEEMLPALAPRVDGVDVFCESIAFSLAQTRQVFEAAQRHGLPIHVHAEQRNPMGGARLAAAMGALSADHLEYLDDEGARAMAAAGTTAVLLPGALYFLRESHPPPLDLLRHHGVSVAIATDANPGTSPCFSILTILNMACILLGLTPEEALAGVTTYAAHALGRQDRIGTLEVGKAADVVLWDVERPAELAYALGYNPCKAVIKRGGMRE